MNLIIPHILWVNSMTFKNQPCLFHKQQIRIRKRKSEITSFLQSYVSFCDKYLSDLIALFVFIQNLALCFQKSFYQNLNYYLQQKILMDKEASKYYHNDYKKIHQIDQTRTKSQKILDRQLLSSSFLPKLPNHKQQETLEDPKPQKKVKSETMNLSNLDILDKLLNTIEGNTNAGKIIKALTILKKCFNDKNFIEDENISILSNIKRVQQKIQVEERITGNFSEIKLAMEEQLQILYKIEQISKQKLKDQEQFKANLTNQIIFCQLYTDDAFTFNKLLGLLKKSIFQEFQVRKKIFEESHTTDEVKLQNIAVECKGMQKIVLKLFILPLSKYEWMKTSLLQLMKQFSINYKDYLLENNRKRYLSEYNKLLNSKNVVEQKGSNSNIFGESKGGKFKVIEFVNADGFDKWTSKQ